MHRPICTPMLLCALCATAHAQGNDTLPTSSDHAPALAQFETTASPEPALPPAPTPPSQGIGSDDWQFDISKAIAAELADTSAWSLAIPYLRELSPKTQDWNILLLQAKIDLQQGDVASAQEGITRALQAHPTNPRIIEMAGHVAADAGHFDQAVEHYEHVLALHPRNATQIKLALARIKFAQQKYQEVIQIYESIINDIQPTSEILVRLSACYENTNDLERAELYLKQNLKVHPNRLFALLPLERFYRRHQMNELADQTAQEREHLQNKDGAPRELRALQRSAR
ncbi:MAG: tetratricopeptide repeat protein [Proteobacteria bacterium]|nr:tetratricopeptide repeat protein [Pseudomonadota bacterium]